MVILPTVPVALMAAGVHRRGRSDAWHRRRARGSDAALRRRAAVGWALLGGGTLLLAAQAGVGMAILRTETDAAFIRTSNVHVATSLLGTALAGAGLGLGPYAGGQLQGRRERSMNLALAPLRLPGGAGLTLGGRF